MNQTNRITFPKNSGRLVLWGLSALLVITVIIKFPDLRNRLWSTWPYLLVLLCPLMHILMHRSHDEHSGRGDHGDYATAARRKAEQHDQSEEVEDE